MSDCWTDVRSLAGRELTTLHGKPFTVQNVTDTHVTVIPQSTGKARPIRRQEVEAAARIPGGAPSLTAKSVRDAGASEVNPVYVVAILQAIPASRPKPPVRNRTVFLCHIL